MEKKRIVWNPVYTGRFANMYLAVMPNGHVREVVETRDSVGILVENPENNSVMLVSQSRAPMASEENPDGMLTEVLAGRFDREETPTALAVRETSEEIGAEIAEEQVMFANASAPLAMSPGVLTERMMLGIVTLHPGQLDRTKVDFGAAHEGEHTRRKEIPIAELPTMVFEDMKTFAVVQAYLRGKAEARIRELEEKVRQLTEELDHTTRMAGGY